VRRAPDHPRRLEPAPDLRVLINVSDDFQLSRRALRAIVILAILTSFSDRVSVLSVPVLVDSDHDGLTDAQELAVGTNPVDPDSDHDGLIDAKDPDWIIDVIRSLPDSAIKSPAEGNRNFMLNLLTDAQDLIKRRENAAARDKLTTLRTKMDGCGQTCDVNDLIINCARQVEVRALVDALLSNL
jgi:hypothetical protein